MSKLSISPGDFVSKILAEGTLPPNVKRTTNMAKTPPPKPAGTSTPARKAKIGKKDPKDTPAIEKIVDKPSEEVQEIVDKNPKKDDKSKKEKAEKAEKAKRAKKLKTQLSLGSYEDFKAWQIANAPLIDASEMAEEEEIATGSGAQNTTTGENPENSGNPDHYVIPKLNQTETPKRKADEVSESEEEEGGDGIDPNMANKRLRLLMGNDAQESEGDEDSEDEFHLADNSVMKKLRENLLMNGEWGDPVDKETAEVFELSLQAKPNKDNDKVIAEKNKVPSNVTLLQPPLINESVYKFVSKYAKQRDKSFKMVQSMMGRTCVPTLKIIEIFSTKGEKAKAKLQRVNEMVAQMVQLQIAAYKQLTKMRKDLLAPDLGDSFTPLFKLKTKVTDQMFGPESDLTSTFTKIEASEKLFEKWHSQKSKNSRGRDSGKGRGGRRHHQRHGGRRNHQSSDYQRNQNSQNSDWDNSNQNSYQRGGQSNRPWRKKSGRFNKKH